MEILEVEFPRVSHTLEVSVTLVVGGVKTDFVTHVPSEFLLRGRVRAVIPTGSYNKY